MHEIFDDLFQRRVILINIMLLKVCNLININRWLNAIISSQGRLILHILLLNFWSFVVRLLLFLPRDQDGAIIVHVKLRFLINGVA